VAVIGGFRSDLSITRETDGNFGNVSTGVLFFKSHVSTKTVVSNESRHARRTRVDDVCDCKQATKQHESVSPFTGIVKDQITKARLLGIK